MPCTYSSKALRHVRVGALALGQRTEGSRVIVDEDRAAQVALDLLLEQVMHQHVVMLAGRVQTHRLGRTAHAFGIVHCDADVFAEQLGILPALPGGREVDGPLAIGELPTAAEAVDTGDDEALGQVHHRLVVAVRLVQFHHREFRLCRASIPSLRKTRPIS